MKDLVYRCLMALERRFGRWIFLVVAWHVATGYFFLFPRRVAVSVRFYRRLFPDRGRAHALWCSWQQYHHFVYVFLDRFRLARGNELTMDQEGLEHIFAAAESGRGGVILMSHVGSWEIAARLLRHHGRNRPSMKLLLYLGEKHQEQIERRQKRSVEESGIRVISVPESGGSAMEIVEGLNFLREGGLVSLTGDRLWGGEQRSVTVRFAGGEARIPEIPFILAMLSGAPLLTFFAYRTGEGRYHLVTYPPFFVTAASRPERQGAVEMAAQAYADLLAETVRAHPYEWYHFEPFFTEHEDRPGRGA
ncbi:MAG: lysophospholipid acyltransferase family protein [Deltaproteobacteria bacterium]|nr:lysophospholipid acyltransferase family protein [Deltaproteobacteria bacterium]